MSQRVLVPVAVRIEAGWDRGDPDAAVVNRVSGARDVPLTSDAAKTAQRLHAATAMFVSSGYESWAGGRRQVRQAGDDPVEGGGPLRLVAGVADPEVPDPAGAELIPG